MTGPNDDAVVEAAIDVHAHVVPRALIDELRDGSPFPHVAVEVTETGPRFTFADAPATRVLKSGLYQLGERRDWMTEQRVRVQAVGGWLDVFGYELAGDEGADWADHLTDSIIDFARDSTDFIPLGTVALQDPERAAEGVGRAAAKGCPGIMIGTRAGGLELDDSRYDAFWSAADEAGAMVFVHPGYADSNPRYQDYGLKNGLARLEDTTVTLARLMYAGVPARYPGMTMVIAHAGAALPYVLGRLAQNHRVSGGVFADPRESFERLHFDTIVFDTESLEYLVRRCGADRVLLGSDFPFPIGDLAPRQVVEASILSQADRAKILGGNARRVLGLDRSTKADS